MTYDRLDCPFIMIWLFDHNKLQQYDLIPISSINTNNYITILAALIHKDYHGYNINTICVHI